MTACTTPKSDGSNIIPLVLAAWTVILHRRLTLDDGGVVLDGLVMMGTELHGVYSGRLCGMLSHAALLHCASTACIFLVWAWRGRVREEKKKKKTKMGAVDEGLGGNKMKPMIWPCKTTHTRLFPKRHSFGYFYLLAGVGVDWQGCVGGLLSSGSRSRWSLFHVDAADHLERSSRSMSLREKFDRHIRQLGRDPGEYAHVYLVTAPRCLGYCFNPVSFWYLYDAAGELRAMMLEVNNTFDERRTYFIEGESDGKTAGRTFRGSWRKDFHVSPFNSRGGNYTFAATDLQPFRGQERHVMSNDITLVSEEGRPKIVAKVFSVSAPLERWPRGWRAGAGFAMRWVWVGWVTFPRILREAGKLYFKHALTVWFRPEVAATSIGRRATSEEKYGQLEEGEDEISERKIKPLTRCGRTLESFFARYLERLTQCCSEEELEVEYERPGDVGGRSVFASDGRSSKDGTRQQTQRRRLQIRVLSPAFYSRLVHYKHTREAFEGEYLCTDERNRSVWIDEPKLLEALLQADDLKSSKEFAAGASGRLDGRGQGKGRAAQMSMSSSSSSNGLLERMRWSLLTWLRCPAARPSYGEEICSEGAGDGPAMMINSTASSSMSGLDEFASRQPDAARYRRAALGLFVGQRCRGLDAMVEWAVRIGVSLEAWRLVHHGVGGWREVVAAAAAMHANHVLAMTKACLV